MPSPIGLLGFLGLLGPLGPLDVGIDHARLLQVMWQGILGEEVLYEDNRAAPFPVPMRFVRSMITGTAGAFLRPEDTTVNLGEMMQFPPSLVAEGPADVNL